MDTYHDAELPKRIAAQLEAHGLADGPLAPEQLFGLDQFHVGGPEPVQRLLGHAELGHGAQVLDLGSGFGGTSRLVAKAAGAEVLGIDRTAGYVKAAVDLTARCGLEDRVRFQAGDVTDLDVDAGAFDAAFLIHVQMNIADKAALFAGVARALRPGGKLLLWEICSEVPEQLDYPVPWSLDGSDSHPVSADVLRAAVEGAGLTVELWDDRTEWAAAWAARIREQGPPPGPALPGVQERGRERIGNLMGAIGSGRVTLIEGVAHV